MDSIPALMHKVLANPHAQQARAARGNLRVTGPYAKGLGPTQIRDTLCEALGMQASSGLPTQQWIDQGGLWFAHGDHLFEAGAPDDRVWLLLSGRVALGRHDANGKWWQSRTVEAGHWLDLTTAWAEAVHTETALALGEVCAMGLELKSLTTWLESHPEVARKLLRDMARHSAHLTLQRQTLITQGIQSRVAAWVLEQAAHHGPQQEWPMQQKKKALASQLGATPETLSRCLRQLHESKLITLKGYQVRVLDMPGLQRLAEMPSPIQP